MTSFLKQKSNKTEYVEKLFKKYFYK